VLIVSVGAFGELAVEVAERLRAQGIGSLVVDPRWVKPVPVGIGSLAAQARLVVILEDGVRAGGVGGAIAQALQDAAVDTPVRSIGIPVRFLDQGKRADVLAECRLTAQDISRSIVESVAGREGASTRQTDPATPNPT